MTKYDSQGVPILGFDNPAGTILYPNGLYSYSIGNTRARDISELLGTSKKQHLDLLLLASGDVRNILFTVSEISLKKTQDCPKSLSFHLNDYDPSVVARNAILLEVAGSINTSVSGDIDFLWNIWYNMTLSAAHFLRLRQVISGLIEKSFDSSEMTVLKFQDSAVLKECRDIWKDWMTLDPNVKSVKEERNKFMEDEMQAKGFKMDYHCFGVVSEMLMGVGKETGGEDVFLPEKIFSSPFYTEVERWFIEGSTGDESDKVNPTLIRPFVHKWKQHYAACPFDGYLPFEKQELLRCKTLTTTCKESLKILVKRYQQYKNAQSTSIKVILWTGDALSLCTSVLPPDQTFDVIDTSNVGDHIGLLNVLVCCAPRLKKPNKSLLYTSSMLWSSCQSIDEFYDKSIGVPVQLLPTVLGLKLAVDLELGSSKLPDSMMTSEEILCWVKAEPKRTSLSTGENGDIIDALLRLVERCFNISNETDSTYGATVSSPLTFLRIIHQIHPLFRGGATALFNALESKLTLDFKKKFGLSWNLVRASVGREREPIVEIKVESSILVFPGYKGTPILTACIKKEDRTYEEREFQWFFGLPLPVEETLSVIYNSVRYDDAARLVTFHLRKKDWDELKSNSARMWIASSDLLAPVIQRDTIFLEGDRVKAVEQIDPVEKFGLFAVQTFDVELSGDCEILKVLKVEENRFSYLAELEIVDSVRCKAKTMKTCFEPAICPNKVTIYFEAAEREKCIMHFSCAVDENSTRFQISRKQGKVTCHIPKREEGTVGELVIQGPAPIPFHVLPLWDDHLRDSIAIICGMMFRTRLDQELKIQNSSGSPFYDLRESISMILNGHGKEPQTPKIYCIEELETIQEPYQTPDDLAKKRGFILKVLGLYKWKNVPVAKVIFYDCEKYAHQICDESTGSRVMSSFWSVTWLSKVERILANQQEKSLFRKLLYTNAARVTQDNGSDVWKDSFVSPLFPRERTVFQSGENLEELMRKLCSSHLYNTAARPAGHEVSPDDPFEFRTGLLQGGMDPFFTEPDRGSNFGFPRWAPPLEEPECALCHSKTGDLKRCLGCKKVFYCGKQCQTQHWKEHKKTCQKNKL